MVIEAAPRMAGSCPPATDVVTILTEIAELSKREIDVDRARAALERERALLPG